MAAGKDINILQATETESVSNYEKRLRAGLSLTLSQTVTTTAKNAYAAGKQAVSNAEESNVIGAGQQAYEAYNTAQAITDPKGEASLTVGVSSSWKSSESYAATAVLSELRAGREAGQNERGLAHVVPPVVFGPELQEPVMEHRIGHPLQHLHQHR